MHHSGKEEEGQKRFSPRSCRRRGEPSQEEGSLAGLWFFFGIVSATLKQERQKKKSFNSIRIQQKQLIKKTEKDGGDRTVVLCVFVSFCSLFFHVVVVPWSTATLLKSLTWCFLSKIAQYMSVQVPQGRLCGHARGFALPLR